MTRKSRLLLGCSIFALLPCVATAAGTYYNYNGSQQRNYGNNSGANPFYNYGAGNQVPCTAANGCVGAQNTGTQYQRSASGKRVVAQNETVYNTTPTQRYVDDATRPGFKLGAGISHQFAMWKFDMNTAGSRLHYDNLAWNVFDANAKYDFNAGSTMVRLDMGAQYGMQSGESSMVDDDLTGGGFFLQNWNVDLNGDGTADQVWVQQGHALSVGTSSGGDMLGLYAGLGLADAWRVGGFKITPSIGYRYFKYKVDTKHNYGMSMDTVIGADNYCMSEGGETQCLPMLVFVDSNNGPLLGTISGVDIDGDGVFDTFSYITVPTGAVYAETENTYYYYQDGVSHSYEVEWSGPYLALDFLYNMSNYDAVNARFEIGLPAYTATGDQPYRPDWQHPKSLEDKGGIGDAYHFGLGANWMHSLTNSLMLTVGMTFDYYSIGKADATSYLNSDYYLTNYYNPAVATNNNLVGIYGNSDYQNWTAVSGRDLRTDQAVYISNLDTIDVVNELKSSGWKQEMAGEIESLYKSFGIRVGISGKF